ncbi:small ribosomal subunit protein mS33 [Euwallacea similis]|uniref:small ribosomal subunit protein mS33 n=1 Tax=Euwallacea similis TaxID=1736056 RepID=UPI00344C6B35
MSNYVKYSDLMKQTTEYARRMTRLSNRIFGEPVRPTNQKSMKVVKLFSEHPVNLRRDVYAYYPRHVETGKLMMKLRYYGLYRDEHQDFKEEMERMRVLRGKVTTKRQPGGSKK